MEREILLLELALNILSGAFGISIGLLICSVYSKRKKGEKITLLTDMGRIISSSN